MAGLGKQDIATQVAQTAGTDAKTASSVIDALVSLIHAQISAGSEMQIDGLGTFRVSQETRTAPGRAAETGGEAHFRAAEGLKAAAKQSPAT